MTDFHSLLTSRRTAHRFSAKPVESSFVTRALQAANQAPCHKHTHPWTFYSIGQETRNKLVPAVTELAAAKSLKKKSDTVEEDLERAIGKVMTPPVLFAVTSKLSPEDAFREKEDYAASVCALHNMVLSLWGDGVAAKWSTSALTRHPETYSVLGIDADVEVIIGFVKAGYAERLPKVEKPSTDATTRFLP